MDFARLSFRDAVRLSPDLERVLSVPRRAPVDLGEGSARAAALVELMTTRLRRPDRPPGAACGCTELGRSYCIQRLLPVQAWALYEAPLAGGCLAPVRVGGGKTVLDILMSVVMPHCRVSALFIPPGLVTQLRSDYLAVREHFIVPSLVMPDGAGWISPGRPALHVVPYSKFSHKSATEYLERLSPDLVLADEAHALKNPKSVRTSRVLRYFAARPQTRLCAWSASITSRSIRDFAHLAAFALGDSSPLPLDPDVVDQWAAAVDPSDWPAPAGALVRLCRQGEDLREGVRRRMAETRGVVSTRDGAAAVASIVLRERKPPAMPAGLVRLLSDLHSTWARPDGEELLTALDVARVGRELACGFYYRWRFPGAPARSLVDEWFSARKAWRRELRDGLRNPIPHLDSPDLLKHAAVRYHAGYVGDLPTWPSETWLRWRDVKDTVAHDLEAIWVDEYLARDAAEWAKKNRGIVWYEHDTFGRTVSRLAGVPLHTGGVGADERIRAEKGDRSIVASIRSHGTGRDGLQRVFSHQLVANPPSDGGRWEQLLGRLVRVGQADDEVVTEVYRNTEEMADAIDRAVLLAKYVEGVTGNSQMLLSADVEWDLSRIKRSVECDIS